MKSLKKITPEFVKGAYHKVRSFHAAYTNNFPARGMIVIGVTGTKGKTSTANYIWSVLHAGGYNAGLVSTAIFRSGDISEINSHHMTMPDPYLIQKKLADMQKAGVEIVVVEMTSEGMKQYRHTGIPVDIAIFTNLTPEHLGSHNGSFEQYKKAKGPLFEALYHAPRALRGVPIPPTILANADSEHAEFYLGYNAERKITFGIENGDIRATGVIVEKTKTTFVMGGEKIVLTIPGVFNVYNALPALIVGQLLNIPVEKIKEGVASLKVIPGRMELIEEGQEYSVIVDYAHEPVSLGMLITAAESMKDPLGKIILLTGVIGGGRESRKPLTKLAAERADILIITNEDPYDEDPETLISELAAEAEAQGKKNNVNLFALFDRREGIRKALSLAKKGDIVLISGKGAEQTMMTKDGAIPWNEREIVRELVQNSVTKKS